MRDLGGGHALAWFEQDEDGVPLNPKQGERGGIPPRARV